MKRVQAHEPCPSCPAHSLPSPAPHTAFLLGETADGEIDFFVIGSQFRRRYGGGPVHPERAGIVRVAVER